MEYRYVGVGAQLRLLSKLWTALSHNLKYGLGDVLLNLRDVMRVNVTTFDSVDTDIRNEVQTDETELQAFNSRSSRSDFVKNMEKHVEAAATNLEGWQYRMEPLWRLILGTKNTQIEQQLDFALAEYPTLSFLRTLRAPVETQESTGSNLQDDPKRKFEVLGSQNKAWEGLLGVADTADMLANELRLFTTLSEERAALSELAFSSRELSIQLNASHNGLTDYNNQAKIASEYYTLLPSIAHTFDDICFFLHKFWTAPPSTAEPTYNIGLQMNALFDEEQPKGKQASGLLLRLFFYGSLMNGMRVDLDNSVKDVEPFAAGREKISIDDARGAVKAILWAQDRRSSDNEVQSRIAKELESINLLPALKHVIDQVVAEIQKGQQSVAGPENPTQVQEMLWTKCQERLIIQGFSGKSIEKAKKYLLCYLRVLIANGLLEYPRLASDQQDGQSSKSRERSSSATLISPRQQQFPESQYRGDPEVEDFETKLSRARELSELGKFERAESLYRMELLPLLKDKPLRHKQFDRDILLEELATVLCKQGRLKEARELFHQALHLREEAFGEEHVATIATFIRTISTLCMYGDHAEAARLSRLLRERRSRSAYRLSLANLIHEGSALIDDMNALAMSLFEGGKRDEAIELQRSDFQLKEELFGAEDSHTVHSMYQLASILALRGDLAAAETLYSKALLSRQTTLGQEHSLTLETMKRLLFVKFKQGKYEEAKELSQQLQLQQNDLGLEDPETLHIMKSLARSPEEMQEPDNEEPVRSANKFRRHQRKYKLRTFQLPTRGEELYMLAFECAQALGYKGTAHFLTENRALSTIVVSNDELDVLVEKKLIPFAGTREIVAVTAESAFQHFGRRIILQGERSTDDDPENQTANTTLPDDKDDILILKHKNTLHTLRFQAHSIGNGLVTVGDVRSKAAIATFWGQERHHRVTLFYQGKRLRHDHKSCREEGLKHLSEILCVTNELGKGPSDVPSSSREGDMHNELESQAAKGGDDYSRANSDALSRSANLAIPEDPDKPNFITARGLFEILQNYPSEDVLLLDLRVAPDYQKSHINGALNLCIPMTLLKRLSFNVQKLAETFALEVERERFSSWRTSQRIIAYDARSSLLKDAASCVHTLQKFTTEGWKGTPAILRGGFAGFSKKYPHMLAGNSLDKIDTTLPPSFVGSSFSTSTNETSASEKIDAMEKVMYTQYFPECSAFLDSPPSDPKVRETEYKRLSEALITNVLLKIDLVETDGEAATRSRREALIQECQDILNNLDFAYHVRIGRS